jgi:hypothetical protein
MILELMKLMFYLKTKNRETQYVHLFNHILISCYLNLLNVFGLDY